MGVNDIINGIQNDGYSQSSCSRYQLFRPMPQGKQVYITLLQFVLLNIVQATTEIFFQVLLVGYFEESGAIVIPTSILFTSFPLLLCLPMGFIADRYFGRAKVLYYSWIFLFIAQLLIACFFIIDSLGYIYDKNLNYISFIGVIIN